MDIHHHDKLKRGRNIIGSMHTTHSSTTTVRYGGQNRTVQGNQYLILSPTSGSYILPPSEHSTKEARACPKMDGLVPRTGITLSRR